MPAAKEPWAGLLEPRERRRQAEVRTEVHRQAPNWRLGRACPPVRTWEGGSVRQEHGNTIGQPRERVFVDRPLVHFGCCGLEVIHLDRAPQLNPQSAHLVSQAAPRDS
jgi:hypothetical protein